VIVEWREVAENVRGMAAITKQSQLIRYYSDIDKILSATVP
jgi:DNA-binding phage protein